MYVTFFIHIQYAVIFRWLLFNFRKLTADKEYIEFFDCEQEMNEELFEQYKASLFVTHLPSVFLTMRHTT